MNADEILAQLRRNADEVAQAAHAELGTVWTDTSARDKMACPASTFCAVLDTTRMEAYVQPGGCLELRVWGNDPEEDPAFMHFCEPDAFIGALIELRRLVRSQRPEGWGMY